MNIIKTMIKRFKLQWALIVSLYEKGKHLGIKKRK
jgi:hypothetical protein|tara:strand:+ start:12762 stop:12866 length:105 start_codon:yes stop_codon:yes gene_type:complete